MKTSQGTQYKININENFADELMRDQFIASLR